MITMTRFRARLVIDADKGRIWRDPAGLYKLRAPVWQNVTNDVAAMINAGWLHVTGIVDGGWHRVDHTAASWSEWRRIWGAA
jgi:hypothetical protein